MARKQTRSFQKNTPGREEMSQSKNGGGKKIILRSRMRGQHSGSSIWKTFRRVKDLLNRTPGFVWFFGD